MRTDVRRARPDKSSIIPPAPFPRPDRPRSRDRLAALDAHGAEPRSAMPFRVEHAMKLLSSDLQVRSDLARLRS
jgi:hypothetical protein